MLNLQFKVDIKKFEKTEVILFKEKMQELQQEMSRMHDEHVTDRDAYNVSNDW